MDKNIVEQTLLDVHKKIDELKKELSDLIEMQQKVTVIDSAIFEDDRYKKFDYSELGYKSSDYFESKKFTEDVEFLQSKINCFETIKQSIERIHN